MLTKKGEREAAVHKGPWKTPDVKHPNPPKNPVSAHLAFSNARRKSIAEANPSMTNGEISSILATLWRQCPASVKLAYLQKDRHEREAFKVFREEWNHQKDLDLVRASMEEDNSTSGSLGSTSVFVDDEETKDG